jgi:hypothetical protein
MFLQRVECMLLGRLACWTTGTAGCTGSRPARHARDNVKVAASAVCTIHPATEHVLLCDSASCRQTGRPCTDVGISNVYVVGVAISRLGTQPMPVLDLPSCGCPCCVSSAVLKLALDPISVAYLRAAQRANATSLRTSHHNRQG